MPASHARQAPSTTSSSALDRLAAFLAAHSRATEPAGELEPFERGLRELFAQALAEVVGTELSRYDLDVPFVTIGGVGHRRVLRSASTYVTASGKVEVSRTLYRHGDEPAVSAMDLRAGIVSGRYTPLAARQAGWAMAHLTSRESEELFRQVGGMAPSRCSLDRLAKDLGGQWEAERPLLEAFVRASEEVPADAVTLAVSLDGVMVPMRDGERARKREAARSTGKRTKGPAGYQEVGCGTVSFYDAEGERLATRKLGRMPESGKTTLKSMLGAELHCALDQRPDLTVVKVADGAADNWTFLTDELPNGEEVLDFFHAAEHLSAACDAAFGEGHARGRAFFEKWRTTLREDREGVAKVIRALSHQIARHPTRRKLRVVRTYFRRNAHRMRYAELRGRCLPIGSGVVEAACKTLATQRLKRSGMRWRHDGGQAVLTLRSLIQSDRFERAWELLAATYRKTVAVPENVIPLRPTPSLASVRT